MPGMTKKKQVPEVEFGDLQSFVDGLYDEMDKLSKKAPSALLSDLATARVNRAIADAREIFEGSDRYVADLREFVAAGLNPEVRDALLVLREIRQALDRAES
jgi:hypothetical protein